MILLVELTTAFGGKHIAEKRVGSEEEFWASAQGGTTFVKVVAPTWASRYVNLSTAAVVEFREEDV